MINKKYNLYIASLCVSLCFFSCKKYFEVDTSDRETLPKTFSTLKGFQNALNGTYSLLYNYYANEFYRYPEAAGNMTDLRSTGAGSLADQHNFTSDPDQELLAVGYIWRKILVTIANANNIIENYPAFVQANPGSKVAVDTIKAQALFIRALATFDLCRTYAQPYNYSADGSHLGVPVVVVNPAPEDVVKRVSVKEVYDQVIKDLKEAEQLFTTNASVNVYYISKKAVQALLARVYLYRGDWQTALTYAGTVIEASPLAYGNEYLAMYSNLNRGEAIFRLSSLQKPVGESLGQVYALTAPVYVAADTLMKQFSEPTDIRLTLFQSDPQSSNKYFTKKWSVAGVQTPDPMVLRASEMYLIRAEAALNLNNLAVAAADLKAIIARGLNKTAAEVVLTETDKNVLERTLVVERTKELSFEGHNFFDITRRKQNLVRGASTSSLVRSLNYPNDRFVLPVPQSELNANPGMIGNPTVNR
jgi:tetratricopeptide (TPR) repeat protein